MFIWLMTSPAAPSGGAGAPGAGAGGAEEPARRLATAENLPGSADRLPLLPERRQEPGLGQRTAGG